MSTVETLQQSIAALRPIERAEIAYWLREFELRQYHVEEAATDYHADSDDERVQKIVRQVADGERDSLTFEEYVELMKVSTTRYELLCGLMFAMSGPSLVHNRICGHLFARFYNHLRGGPCVAYASDATVRLKITEDVVAYLPDVMVACEKWDASKHWVDQPRLIVEVLSPSTHLIDRREKLQNYRTAESLEEYVLVSQTVPEVTIYRRKERWKPSVVRSVEAHAEFRSIDLTLPLAQIYENAL